MLPLLLVSLCHSVCGTVHRQYSLYVDVLCHGSLTSNIGVTSSSSPSSWCLSMSTSIFWYNKILVALSQHYTATQNFSLPGFAQLIPAYILQLIYIFIDRRSWVRRFSEDSPRPEKKCGNTSGIPRGKVKTCLAG